VKRTFLILSLAGAIGLVALNSLVMWEVLRPLPSLTGIWKAETADGEYYLDFRGDGRVVSSHRRRHADGRVLEGEHIEYSYELEDAKTVSIFLPGLLPPKSLRGELRLLSKDEMLQSSSRGFDERVMATSQVYANLGSFPPLAARSDVVYKRSPN
jgi:hypothetical protein